MKVCYVTMAFPVATETFACTDVRALLASGVSVSVQTLRAPRPRGLDEALRPFAWRRRAREAARLLAARGLGDLPVTHGSVAAVWRGLRFGAGAPRIVGSLLSWVVRQHWRRPTQLMKSLSLVPRALDILATLQRQRADVVHLFWGHYPAMVGYLVRRYLPETVLSMFLGAYDLERRYAGSGSLARTADVVWTHARCNISRVTTLGVAASRVRLAYRGIDAAAFQPNGVQKIPRRLLTAGRLCVEKGIYDVLGVFAQILSAWPDASLIVLGDGPERQRLTAVADRWGIGGRIAFRGHVGQDEVRTEMAAAEVFVSMSRSVSERLPNVVKEAMASRCACVVTETPGIEELVTHGTNGFVVAQGDVDGASRQVDALLRDRAHAATVGENARRHVLTHFDVAASMKLYRDCWTQLVLARNP